MKRIAIAGFTIVELLIVVVVIAILAAITLVTYTGIQNLTHDSVVQSDLADMGKSIEINRIKSSGSAYPFSTDANTLRGQLATLNIQPSKGSYLTDGLSANLLYITNNSGADFALVAKSKSGKVFYYSNISGSSQEYTATSFPSVGAGPVRVSIFDIVTNESPAIWGYGGNGWAPQWIK